MALLKILFLPLTLFCVYSVYAPKGNQAPKNLVQNFYIEYTDRMKCIETFQYENRPNMKIHLHIQRQPWQNFQCNISSYIDSCLHQETSMRCLLQTLLNFTMHKTKHIIHNTNSKDPLEYKDVK